MPDNANPILKSNSAQSKPATSALSQPSSVSTDRQRRTFLSRVQQASVQEDPYYLDSVDLLDEEDSEEGREKANANGGKAEEEEERINSEEIFDLIRSITDPEHPLTLEDLSVVSPDQITVSYPLDDPDRSDSPHVMVRFTPTIPHCSMATLIGLTLRVRLLRSLPERFKVDIKIKEGTHQSENSVNKQLNDKERVAAALENNHLLGVVQQCLSTAHLRGAKPGTN
ncbi:hypothetical protein PTTG_06575 [Puccinia triticina 1-1 BBBD Race 1]|uniref:FeS_assembly_P domain-containing protein n=2 Tax=Puccinia triticina TaxID=208348 RepID=A0A0C4F0F9_PUCT1|nr:hypothetical protein PTTG_06575 [Puccinia triticina 1-1 BBBD Race 1]